MSHLRTPEMIHFPFVLILFLNKHWVLNVKPECKTDHVSVCAVSIDTQRPQCGKKKKNRHPGMQKETTAISVSSVHVFHWL